MKRIFLITFLSIFIFKVYGQDNIGTPYSVYGIGLQTENAGPYNAMGGVAAETEEETSAAAKETTAAVKETVKETTKANPFINPPLRA